jgi:hypothetical protein
MGDSKSSQTMNSTSQSTSAPSPLLQPYLKSIVERMGGYIDRKPTLYLDSFTAPPSQGTNQAVAGLEDYGRTGLGGGGTMPINADLVNRTLRGDYLDLSKGPMDAAIRASIAPALEAFTDSTLPALRSTFASAGRPGAGLEGDAIQKAMLGLNRSTQETGAKIGADFWNQERSRQLQTQGMLPTFQNIELQRLGALGQGGAMRDAYNQRARDEAVMRYNYNNEGGDLDFLTNLSQRLLAAYPGGQTSGTSFGYGTGGGGGGFGSILGAGMGIAGLGLQALPLFGFSDERLKDVEGRVGYTDEGLPLYLYRYKGEDQPRIGPMAQEVAQVKPEAVARHPSGYLAVDYAQLMPEGGLL